MRGVWPAYAKRRVRIDERRVLPLLELRTQQAAKTYTYPPVPVPIPIPILIPIPIPMPIPMSMPMPVPVPVPVPIPMPISAGVRSGAGGAGVGGPRSVPHVRRGSKRPHRPEGAHQHPPEHAGERGCGDSAFGLSLGASVSRESFRVSGGGGAGLRVGHGRARAFGFWRRHGVRLSWSRAYVRSGRGGARAVCLALAYCTRAKHGAIFFSCGNPLVLLTDASRRQRRS